jgi:FkbM family methyltransferase
MAAWKVRRRLSGSITFSTIQGRFKVLTSDGIVARKLYVDGQFEFDSSVAFVKLIHQLGLTPKQPTLLDIGANLGMIGIGLLRAGLVGRVVAVEPEPRNFDLLVQNVALNGLGSKVTCLPLAASDRQGELEFELCEENFGDHRVRSVDALNTPIRGESSRRVMMVPAVPLDEVSDAANADLIWIDVQGHEAHAFRGARSILSRGVPTMSEIWPYGLLRAGTTPEHFAALASEFWSHYRVESGSSYDRRPICELQAHMDAIGPHGGFGNVVFTRE